MAAGVKSTWWRRVRAAAVAAVAATAATALAGAGMAAADTSGSGTPTGGASQLGGYNLSSSAAGVSVFYEQPNFFIPATPTFEFDFGWSTATFNAGPVGTADSSALWPGSIIAGGGSQLPLLIGPYFEQYAPPLAPTVVPLIPNFGNWALQAQSAYPQGPATANNDNGPVAMNSSADQTASTASAAVGQVGGPASQSALPAGMLTIKAVGSTAQDTVDDLGNAIAEATSTVHGVDLAGGLVHVGEVTSTATSSSDGTNAQLKGSSEATGVTVAGEAVTVDSSGVHVVGNSQNPVGQVLPDVDKVLSTAGISITLTNPADTVSGASGQRQLDGLAITIDLSTYDQNLTKLMAMLPSQLTSGLAQLPVPTPYKQSVTFDFGWVKVNAAASPAFNVDLGSTDNSGGDAGALATLGSGDTGTGTDLGLGTPALGSSVASGTTPSTTAGASEPVTATTPTAALFKGVGTGLILLGLLFAALVVYLLMRADRAVGALVAGTACAGEDLGEIG